LPISSKPAVLVWRRRAQTLLEQALAAGTQGYDADTRRRLRVLNLVSYLIAAVNMIYTVENVMIDARLFWPVIVIDTFLAVIALSVPLAHRLHETAGGLMLAGAEYVALFVLTRYLGRDTGLQLQYFIGVAAPFVIFGLRRLWLVASIVVSGTLLHLAVWFLNRPETASIPLDQAAIDQLYLSATLVTSALIAATVHYAYHLAERARREVDELLHNILPAPIVERLKAAPGRPIADEIADASVMFLDLVGFTPLAKRLGPVGTVNFLGTLFQELDTLAGLHGVEKIKTIGDAYMVAAGVPDVVADHPARLARMALAARDCVRAAGASYGEGIDCRIGIASGRVMAGVIGTRKFSYDVWGDTVNLAARMEEASETGRILLPADSALRLQGEFLLQPAGRRRIRGVGEVECRFLEALPAMQ
jgi:adenylate cyclase